MEARRVPSRALPLLPPALLAPDAHGGNRLDPSLLAGPVRDLLPAAPGLRGRDVRAIRLQHLDGAVLLLGGLHPPELRLRNGRARMVSARRQRRPRPRLPLPRLLRDLDRMHPRHLRPRLPASDQEPAQARPHARRGPQDAPHDGRDDPRDHRLRPHRQMARLRRDLEGGGGASEALPRRRLHLHALDGVPAADHPPRRGGARRDGAGPRRARTPVYPGPRERRGDQRPRPQHPAQPRPHGRRRRRRPRSDGRHGARGSRLRRPLKLGQRGPRYRPLGDAPHVRGPRHRSHLRCRRNGSGLHRPRRYLRHVQRHARFHSRCGRKLGIPRRPRDAGYGFGPSREQRLRARPRALGIIETIVSRYKGTLATSELDGSFDLDLLFPAQ